MTIKVDVFHHLAETRCKRNIATVFEEILENRMSKTDDQIAQFKTDVDAKFAVLGTALDNVAADEAKILADLAAISTAGLSQASLDALASVVTSLSAASARSQALADSIPDAPAAPVPAP